MRIHCIIHEPFEGIGCIKKWIQLKGHSLSFTLTFNKEAFPKTENFDWLIIMGGGMSVYEDKKYPGLRTEKRFLKKVIKEKKTILGICLGSQFLADALGAKVYPAIEKEIGWFPLTLNKDNWPEQLQSLPQTITVFHWHGDTFDLPDNTVHLASSELTLNQAFLYNDNALALQYHYEVDEEAVKLMIEHADEELSAKGLYIQKKEQIVEGLKYVEENNKIMFQILDYLESKTKA